MAEDHETYHVKVIITERNKLLHSIESSDSRATESQTSIREVPPAMEAMITSTSSAGPETKDPEGGSIPHDHAGAVLSRYPDTRSVTFNSSEYNEVESRNNGKRTSTGRHEISNTELSVSSDTLGIDKDIARRNAEATEDILNSVDYSCENNTSVTEFYAVELQRARTNTPTSTYCTDVTEGKLPTTKSQHLDESISKNAIYQEATSLIAERCASVGSNRRSTDRQIRNRQPLGIKTPEYFYIEQNRPTPMTPLQAWRGFHGNIYFEPIKVKPVNYSPPEHPDLPLEKCSEQLRDILKKTRRVQSSKSVPVAPAANEEYTRTQPLTRSMINLSRNSAKSPSSTRIQKGNRKMAVLDKKMVLSGNNQNIHEDIIWIVGQESTGSLYLENDDSRANESGSRSANRHHHQQQPNAMRQRQANGQQSNSGQQRRATFNREKICRGSVVRKTQPARNVNKPAFTITGGRFAQQCLQSSPLLRTQTQYSHSNQRCLHSPDVFAGLDKLPPLEQLRASLKHIEPDNRGRVTHVITPLDRIKFEDADSITKSKPFVRYSREVTNTARLRNEQMASRQQLKVI